MAAQAKTQWNCSQPFSWLKLCCLLWASAPALSCPLISLGAPSGPGTFTCSLCPPNWLQSDLQAHLILPLLCVSPGHLVKQILQSHRLPPVRIWTQQEAPERACKYFSVGVSLCGCEQVCTFMSVCTCLGVYVERLNTIGPRPDHVQWNSDPQSAANDPGASLLETRLVGSQTPSLATGPGSQTPKPVTTGLQGFSPTFNLGEANVCP